MKKYTKGLLLLLLVLLGFSCQKKISLQQYLVESQEKNGFVTIDIPTSFLQLKSEAVSDQLKATLERIHKINIVAFPVKENQEIFEIEKQTLKSIFAENEKYKSLMSMKVKDMNMHFYYTGKTASINEVIAFGYGDEIGVGVARLLGENMNPTNMIAMINNLKIDANSLNLKQFNAIFAK
jgi:hypothetical protein